MARIASLLIDAAAASGALALALALKRSVPLILMYHGVSARRGAPDGLRNYDGKQLALAFFIKHLRLLRRSRRVIPLSELVAGLEQRQDMSNAVVITFDDGYENNALVAAPALADFNMPAAFFLTTGLVGTESCIWTDRLEIALDRTDAVSLELPGGATLPTRSLADKRRALISVKAMLKLRASQRVEEIAKEISRRLGVADICAEGDYRFMCWDQARALVRTGFEVGAHTVTHPILSNLPFDEAVLEMLGSKDSIERETGQCSSTFCFPNGKRSDFSVELIEVCRRHFKAALSSERGAATVEDLFELKRLSPAGPGRGETLEWLLLRTR
ncbi:peptidoglycan/xylan/chitin deacetylase (PgdA/CDA1 family) [Janthinobacterium sp. CG_23.3]|uniref:polysaccharide deacetylase family protein n=1 Tax=unclassified Janthinobacterium TaxID=2610881 RepID=UPI0003476DE4|nr:MULTISPECIES: polysaccharide deacetylase family protein [unclassified Janthinobacterium]MEC5161196.1 peptidoglycan/xylan/chitin deacetylase (PgdA/CDA1 family) [Janthinobacterium sp. CG_S6]